jgi:hypothetical protein
MLGDQQHKSTTNRRDYDMKIDWDKVRLAVKKILKIIAKGL